jgi:type IV secretion system protein VirB9
MPTALILAAAAALQTGPAAPQTIDQYLGTTRTDQTQAPARKVKAAAPAPNPLARVAEANAAARMEPLQDAYANAAQIYPFSDGALYQVYATPGEVSDIVLQDGEQLTGAGPVAAGDTARWVIGNTESGSGATKRVHILIKPTAQNLKTNLVINTDRRTYHLELRATPATYMASVAWKYPADPVVASPAPPAAPPVPPAIEGVNFDYRIKGDRPIWRPVRVYDDGRQTVIEFPAAVAQAEMPPLSVDGPDGKPTSLVNYRVSGQRLIVDRLFAKAQLKLGQGRGQQKVDIERLRRP